MIYYFLFLILILILFTLIILYSITYKVDYYNKLETGCN
uniref:Uncharacterized protein n=1 Tax=viral metagenome TaxID=1070528 RepID=A0A6C0DN92_9ZZZZ